jgi:DNA-binding MurR/RpiR family transcriptional regulator
MDASVREIADRVGVSPSSVIRVCQRAGLSGVHELKLVLAGDITREQVNAVFTDAVSASSMPRDILAIVLRHNAQTVLDAAHTIDEAVFEATVQRVVTSGQLLIVGNGTSRGPAFDCAYRLTSLGIVARHAGDALEQHLLASQLTSKDLCVCVSHSGTTRETLAVAEAARAAGASVATITSFRDSPLAEMSDLVLVAGAPEYGFRHEAMVGRVAHVAVIDALFVAVAMAKPGALELSRALTSAMRNRHTGLE